MKVTFSMVLEQTSLLLGVAPVSSVCRFDGPVRAVAPLCEGTTLYDDTLYVCGHLPPLGHRPVQMLCISANSEEFASGNAALFPPAVTHSALLARTQEALNHFIRWSDHILDMIYTGQGLDAIVNFAYGMFKNPILIYDNSLKVLSYTRNDGSTDRMWQDTVRKGTVSSMNAEEARELLRYVNKLDNSPKPFKHTAKDLTDPFYNGNILLDGRRVGMVDLMEHNHPVTPGELDLLEAFCYLLSFELQKDAIRRESRGIAYHQLIVDLLEGAIRDTSTLSSRLMATRWTPSAFARVVCFQPENEFMTSSALQQSFDHLLTLSIGRSILRDREIILLLSCKESQLSEDLRQILRSFCVAHQLRCGVSDAFDNLLETSLFAPQAATALTLSDAQIVFFSNVRFNNLLRLCRSQNRPSEFLHPAVLQLAEQDKAHGTDYLPTLKALFSAQFNQVLAARALHIHRTTLIYRLQRISEMTGLNLSNAEEMLYVHLSLCLYRSGR